MKRRTAEPSDGWWDVAWWSLLGLTALAFTFGIARAVSPAYVAAFGHTAVSGTFVPQHSECRFECTYYGTFDSADGRVRLSSARMHEPFISIHKGEPVAAVWPPGDSPEVFKASGSRVWLEWSALLALALAVVITSLIRLPRLIRNARSAR
jgi:hypothetical protein